MAGGRLSCILLPNSSHGCMVRPTLGDTSGHGTILIPWRMNNWCASNERWAGALSLRNMVQHFRCQCMTDSSAHPNRTAHQRRHPETRLHYAHSMRLQSRHHMVSPIVFNCPEQVALAVHSLWSCVAVEIGMQLLRHSIVCLCLQQNKNSLLSFRSTGQTDAWIAFD